MKKLFRLSSEQFFLFFLTNFTKTVYKIKKSVYNNIRNI